MAKKRMFSLDIIDTDLFQEMPQTSRLLYYELCMRADDDGFVASPKKIMKLVGCNDDDFKILIAKKFVIPFETGIVVIRHWKIHNYIQSDRYKETIYQEEKKQLNIDKNGIYEVMDTECIQDVYKMYTQYSIDKNSIDKNSIDKNSIYTHEDVTTVPEKKKEDKIHFAEFVAMTNVEHDKLVNTYGKEFTDQCIEILDNYKGANGKKYKSDYRAILNWVVDKVKEKQPKSKGNHIDFRDLV